MVQNDKSNARWLKCGKLGITQMSARMTKIQVGMVRMILFAMTCYENSEDNKNGDRDDENKQESKIPDDDERNAGPGTARNTEEPQGTPYAVVCKYDFYDWNRK